MSETGIPDSSEEYPGEFSTVTAVMLAQFARAHKPAEPKARFNPRPPGVIQPGSATEAVYQFLLENHRFFTQQQIMWKTKRSHSAVSWALLRLRTWGRVEAIDDAARNGRYLRYRAVKEKNK